VICMNLLRRILLKGIFRYEASLLCNYNKALKFLTRGEGLILDYISRRKLEYAFYRALGTPAYLDFLKRNKIIPCPKTASEIIEHVPVTDKKNYIKRYSHEMRCIKGRLPTAGNIDESAGSSGVPMNWVRSYDEEALLLKAFNFEYIYLFKPKKQVIVISAWSSGPWATGVKFCELVEHFSLIKNTGPDIEEIITTLRTFGRKYHYIISGYPLFLQSLFESDFPWKSYEMDIITGGDGYSAVWPKKIRGKLKQKTKIISAYGCSDIDIGIAVETPFAQAIREVSAHNKLLLRRIFGNLQTVPMLFQYNPSFYYIQNLPSGEFAVTHLDQNVISPKIKYNVHDIGRSIPFREMRNILREYADGLIRMHTDSEILHLPFLFVAGRSDGTLSFDGANVYPEQIDIILTKYFLRYINNFKLVKKEHRRQPFHILIELRRGVKGSSALLSAISKKVSEHLPLLNRDFADSLVHNPSLLPIIEIYPLESDPFKNNQNKIKYKFVEFE